MGPRELLPAGTRSSRHALGWTKYNVKLLDRYDTNGPSNHDVSAPRYRLR